MSFYRFNLFYFLNMQNPYFLWEAIGRLLGRLLGGYWEATGRLLQMVVAAGSAQGSFPGPGHGK